jgi:hypothetical protein
MVRVFERNSVRRVHSHTESSLVGQPPSRCYGIVFSQMCQRPHSGLREPRDGRVHTHTCTLTLADAPAPAASTSLTSWMRGRRRSRGVPGDSTSPSSAAARPSATNTASAPRRFSALRGTLGVPAADAAGEPAGSSTNDRFVARPAHAWPSRRIHFHTTRTGGASKGVCEGLERLLCTHASFACRAILLPLYNKEHHFCPLITMATNALAASHRLAVLTPSHTRRGKG